MRPWDWTETLHTVTVNERSVCVRPNELYMFDYFREDASDEFRLVLISMAGDEVTLAHKMNPKELDEWMESLVDLMAGRPNEHVTKAGLLDVSVFSVSDCCLA